MEPGERNNGIKACLKALVAKPRKTASEGERTRDLIPEGRAPSRPHGRAAPRRGRQSFRFPVSPSLPLPARKTSISQKHGLFWAGGGSPGGLAPPLPALRM